MALCSSHYALEEARSNLAEDAQKRRLEKLTKAMKFFDAIPRDLPRDLALPEKDVPILPAATASRATRVISGDFHDFGRYFRKTIEGVLVSSPADYLRKIGL